MSTRNSHTAKAARRQVRQQRPRQASTEQARIADAVHQAVCEVLGGDGFGKCAYYARPGALVAACMTGHEYAIQAGSMHVCTDDDDPGMGLGMVPAMSDYSGLEFHAWFMRVPPGIVAGEIITGEAAQNIEVADLGMRHYRRMAEAAGITWNRAQLPPYYWGSFSGLASLGVSLKADARMTKQIIDNQETDLFAEISAVALRKLGQTRMAERLREMT